jgi:hypothetical protein
MGTPFFVVSLTKKQVFIFNMGFKGMPLKEDKRDTNANQVDKS